MLVIGCTKSNRVVEDSMWLFFASVVCVHTSTCNHHVHASLSLLRLYPFSILFFHFRALKVMLRFEYVYALPFYSSV